MRFFLILPILLLLSCGTSRIKKVPVKHFDREIVSAEVDSRVPLDFENRDQAHNESIVLDEIATKSTIESSEPSISLKVTEIDDEPEISQEEKLIAALATEQKAKTSKNVLTAAFIITLVSWLFPPILLVSLVLLIIGAIQYSKAKNARFNTVEGEFHLKRAKNMMIVTSILFALVLLIIIGVVLVFLFF
jgi:uncharacterized membrane protein